MILGFSGKRGSGKDTISQAAVERLGIADKVVNVAFADTLKDIVDDYIHICRAADHPDVAVEKSRTLDGGHVPRHVRQYMVELLFGAAHADVNEHARSHSPHVVPALQFYGTEFRRALDENYWVNKTQARLQSLEMAGKIPVVTDGRFPNEILSILDLGGEVVRIEVDPQVRAQRLQARDGFVQSGKMALHPSETALDDFEDFSLIVDNSGSLEKTVDEVADYLRGYIHKDRA